MRQGLVFAALALALAVAGCNITPRKAYDGPSRPARDLSILKGGAYGDELSPVSVVDLRAIDGTAQRGGTYLASVLPGRHLVGVIETLRIATSERSQFCAFPLETVAACTYAPRPPSPPTDAIARRVADWEWSVDMPVNIQCADRAVFVVRVTARCGSSANILQRPGP
jgi:hypothetical protein